jgi:hypothetical protein
MKTYDELGESAEDRARDEHLMRGGMAARKDYDRPPAKKLSNAELGIKPGKTWVQKQMEKKAKTALKNSFEAEGEVVEEGLGKRIAAAGAAGAIALGAGGMMGKKVEKDIKQVRSGDVTNVKKGTLYDKIAKRNAMLKQLQNQSFDPEGEMTEEASDRARDEHQMRGGMAARKDYDRPPAKKLSNKELGIKPGKTWVQKQMEKK